MIKNYLLTAFRNILRNKRISAINIFGLSFSMSIGMLIIILLIDQFSYDNFLERNDDIYRIQTIDKLSSFSLNKSASTVYPLAAELRNNYPFVEKITALNNRFGGEAKIDDKLLRIDGLYAEENFFDFFSFKLLRGSRDEVLKDPFSIVLKEETAKKFFGDEDPIGKTIEIDEYGILTVTGIVESSKKKTHIQFESLVSASTIKTRALQEGGSTDDTNNWENAYSNWVYIIPHKGTDLAIIQTALDDISTERYSQNDKIDNSFYLYPFNKIVPGPIVGNELGVSMPKIYLIFFGGLALVVIISAAFNYTSLSIARSLTRAKEFGIRKSIGATRNELVFQIFIEAILISLLSLILAAALLQLILPFFIRFKMMALMEVNPAQNLAVYLWFLVFALFTGIIAGGLPAIYISRINPVSVLKGAGNLKIFKRLTFRKILLVSQYFFSIVFIISIIVIYRQMIFMVNADMGFNRDAVYNIDCRNNNVNIAGDHFSRIPEVESISSSTHIAGLGSIRNTDVKIKSDDEDAFETNYIGVGTNYLSTMGIKLIAGDDFPAYISSDIESFVLLSQDAVEKYNLGSSEDAIGQNIIIDDSINVSIIGVFEDFKYVALFLPTRPFIIRYMPNNTRYAVLNLNTRDLEATTEKLKSAWKEIDPEHKMQGLLLDTEIRDFYAYFEDILYMVGYTTLLAIIIACLGLYGMASYSIQTRTKEVGIRKVYGAATLNIVNSISKSFMILLLIAAIVGAPISFLLNNAWLNFIPYHVPFGAGTICTGVLIVILIGMFTISSQTMKVAATNPAQTLKYE